MKVGLDLPRAPLTLRADPVQLERVLQNLGRNAAEVTGGTGTVRISCERLEGERVLIVFSDDGPGIAESVLPRLFEPFHTTKKNGTGLGLSIAKAVVDAHGGKMEVRTGTGEGASFRIVLPAAAAGEGMEGAGSRARET